MNPIPGWFCECDAGFTGDLCEVDRDECADGTTGEGIVCNNQGKCVNHEGYYDCFCKAGYSGVNCHIEKENVIPNNMMVDVTLHKGTLSKTSINSIAGMFHRDRNLQTIDQDGLSYRPIYKNKKTGATFHFTKIKDVLHEGRHIQIKRWKIGNFHQVADGHQVANYKSPFEKGFINIFADLAGNEIKISFNSKSRCDTDPDFKCANGSICKDGICEDC